MKDRIKEIMIAQHMTQQVFADYIGQSPATLSSIFNGRTRPTINIVEAIKKKIPNISTDWLMFGSGDMFLPDSSTSPSPEGTHFHDDLSPDQHQLSQNLMLDFEQNQSSTPQNGFSTIKNFNSVKSTRSETVFDEVKHIDKPQRCITEIRVFYDDQTWETFVPQKKS